MLSTNHVMAGVLIGSVATLPVAVPAAFVSHFAMDLVPHYGMERHKRDGSMMHKFIIYGDALLALSLNIPVFIHFSPLAGAYHSWRFMLCGWVAASPDFSLVYYYFTHGRTLNTYHDGLLKKLHLDFHYERPWALIPELGIMVVLVTLFFHQLG